ncbi:hypothetical protein [Caulobacter vibrioides]|uniref:Uncharacterized protein n=1 Tax=Caulobacter phage S2B TaxID=2759120 RepID=A0AAE7SY69_9CAUD|nr:hypothetical protein [Caulobacter vibrioides]QOC54177.1 hypothetical protein [Caulobacter phage S2B]QXZ50207.1 hypothetical protein KZH45_09750 [Caulobacter vibrioides]
MSNHPHPAPPKARPSSARRVVRLIEPGMGWDLDRSRDALRQIGETGRMVRAFGGAL